MQTNHYRSRSRRMATIMITVSVTPMILVSAIILYQFRDSYQAKIRDHLEEVVGKHQQSVDGFLNDKLADIRFVTTAFGYERLAEETFLGEVLAWLRETLSPGFVDLGVIDSDGTQIAYAGPYKLREADYSDAAWFREAIESPGFISDVFLGLRNLPHFIVAVRGTHLGSPWLLRATIDFAAFNNLVESIRIGETGSAFIVNREGELQTRPLLSRSPTKRYDTGFLWPPRSDGPEVHIAERSDGTGNTTLYVSALLKGGDWLLIYEQDAADAFADLKETYTVTSVILLLGILVISSTAWAVSRRMFRRIARGDEERELMNEQMVQTGKLASVGELAAGIAHEINNPVAIMVEEAGWIEDLLEEESDEGMENLEELRRALGQIRNQGKRCKEITHKLLSFARRTDSHIQDVQVNELLEEVLALSAQRAKFSNVTLSTAFEEGMPPLRASQTELQQVFLNLINNALDAMESKGGSIEVTTQSDPDFVTVFVADTGPGIPRANLDRIFDPFFTTKAVGKGTGLGLSICYGIIKRMGGDIDVRSILDVGTTFRLRFPRNGNGEGERSERAAPSVPPASANNVES